MDMQSLILPLYSKLGYPVETAASDVFVLTVSRPMILRDLDLVLVNETTDMDTTLAQISVDVTPVGGARTEKVVWTLEDNKGPGTVYKATAAGTPLTEPLRLVPGDILYLEQKVQGADPATVAGEYIVWAYIQLLPDGKI